jgi:hypothetical protein
MIHKIFARDSDGDVKRVIRQLPDYNGWGKIVMPSPQPRSGRLKPPNQKQRRFPIPPLKL